MDARFRRILLPTDLSDEMRPAYAVALKLALGTSGHLTVVHSHAEGEPMHWGSLPQVREVLAAWGVLAADASVEEYRALGMSVAPRDTDDRNPTAAVEHASNVDLLVAVTHARDTFQRIAHPSEAQRMARRLGKPTLFMPVLAVPFVDPVDGRVDIAKVMVPVAQGWDPGSAIDAAVALAADLGVERAQGVLVHVGGPADMPAVDLSRWPEWVWSTRYVQGRVVDGILEAADEIKPSLIAMGTHGHDSVGDAVRGSLTERVLNRSRWPILAIPT
jgi:nucleotide-binding universal stress UspA family protein